MKFSIVTPVFNGLPWLPDAVASVAGQRPTVDVEHIILDGGSTDGSREWLAAHADLGFQLVLEPDDGQTDALAKGFAQATGEILGWLNADDLLEPNALRLVSEAFEHQRDAILVSGGCLLIDEDGVVTGAIPVPPRAGFEDLLRYPTNLAQPATFFRAQAYRDVGGVDRRYDMAMDVDLWFRLARRGRVILLPDAVLARFRVHPAAKSVAGQTSAIREDLAIRRRNGLPLYSRASRYLLWHGTVRPWLHDARQRLRHAMPGSRR